MIKISKKIKNVLILSGLITLLLLILNNRNIFKYKEDVNIKDNIYILNNTEYDVELKTKLIISKIFKYDSLYIRYDYMPVQAYIGELELSAFIVKNILFDNQYVIYMSKKIKPYHEDIVISHELFHLKQYESCELIMVNPFSGIFIYKNDTIDMNNVSYYDRPFEKDAYSVQDTIYTQLQKLLKK